MFTRRFLSSLVLSALVVALAGCAGSLTRDNKAAKAKIHMIGMPREEVLACMGPPKKKAVEGGTEVWSYLSTDGQGDSLGSKLKSSSLDNYTSSHSKKFCTVNVVLREGEVKAVHYLGPTATNFYNENDQCGYAVAACVDPK